MIIASILVIERKHIPEPLLKQGFNPAPESLVKSLLENPQLFFMQRDLAENDPNYKQLIPYVVFQSPKGFLSHQRGKLGQKQGLGCSARLELVGTSKKKMATSGKTVTLKDFGANLKKKLESIHRTILNF